MPTSRSTSTKPRPRSPSSAPASACGCAPGASCRPSAPLYLPLLLPLRVKETESKQSRIEMEQTQTQTQTQTEWTQREKRANWKRKRRKRPSSPGSRRSRPPAGIWGTRCVRPVSNIFWFHLPSFSCLLACRSSFVRFVILHLPFSGFIYCSWFWVLLRALLALGSWLLALARLIHLFGVGVFIFDATLRFIHDMIPWGAAPRLPSSAIDPCVEPGCTRTLEAERTVQEPASRTEVEDLFFVFVLCHGICICTYLSLSSLCPHTSPNPLSHEPHEPPSSLLYIPPTHPL